MHDNGRNSRAQPAEILATVMLILNSGWSKRCEEFGDIDETHQDAIFIAAWGVIASFPNII